MPSQVPWLKDLSSMSPLSVIIAISAPEAAWEAGSEAGWEPDWVVVLEGPPQAARERAITKATASESAFFILHSPFHLFLRRPAGCRLAYGF